MIKHQPVEKQQAESQERAVAPQHAILPSSRRQKQQVVAQLTEREENEKEERKNKEKRNRRKWVAEKRRRKWEKMGNETELLLRFEQKYKVCVTVLRQFESISAMVLRSRVDSWKQF
jgi:CelD/BcsL family acetyltransferase involved in cellulose biosynthesis